jgi:hypothetical protein
MEQAGFLRISITGENWDKNWAFEYFRRSHLEGQEKAE